MKTLSNFPNGGGASNGSLGERRTTTAPTFKIFVGRRLALKFQSPSVFDANELFEMFASQHPEERTITLYEGNRDMANLCVQLRNGN